MIRQEVQSSNEVSKLKMSASAIDCQRPVS
jgi:hypothetical protein